MGSVDTIADKETLILGAARKRFAYFGYSKVTMDEIAADVGMAKASLYYYYPNKERLFERVVMDEQHQFIHDIEGVITRDIPAGDKLREYVDKRFQLFRELLNLSTLGVQNLLDVKSLFGDLFRKFQIEELKLVRQIMDAGSAAGEFAIPNPHRTAQLFLHILHGLRLRAFLHSSEPPPDDKTYAALRKEMESCVEHFINGIRNHS